MELLHVAQSEPSRERVGEVELAAGDVRAAVDDLGQHGLAVVCDEDARTTGKRRMRDADRVGTDHAAARGGAAERSRARRAGEGGVRALLLRRRAHVVARLHGHRERGDTCKQGEPRKRDLALREPHPTTASSVSPTDSRTRSSKSSTITRTTATPAMPWTAEGASRVNPAESLGRATRERPLGGP